MSASGLLQTFVTVGENFHRDNVLPFSHRLQPAKSGHTGLKQRARCKPTPEHYEIATSTLFLLHLELADVIAQPYAYVAKVSTVGVGVARLCAPARSARSRG